MRLITMLALVLLTETLIGDARMPEVGDYVALTQSTGILEKLTFGWVTELNSSLDFMSVDRDMILYRTGFLSWRGGNDAEYLVCISLPTVISLEICPVAVPVDVGARSDAYRSFLQNATHSF
jgi:hypothetical protein